MLFEQQISKMHKVITIAIMFIFLTIGIFVIGILVFDIVLIICAVILAIITMGLWLYAYRLMTSIIGGENK